MNRFPKDTEFYNWLKESKSKNNLLLCWTIGESLHLTMENSMELDMETNSWIHMVLNASKNSLLNRNDRLIKLFLNYLSICELFYNKIYLKKS